MYVTPDEMQEDLERRRRQREHIADYYDRRATQALQELDEAHERLKKSLDLCRIYSD